jgi:hypothetical protein
MSKCVKAYLKKWYNKTTRNKLQMGQLFIRVPRPLSRIYNMAILTDNSHIQESILAYAMKRVASKRTECQSLIKFGWNVY